MTKKILQGLLTGLTALMLSACGAQPMMSPYAMGAYPNMNSGYGMNTGMLPNDNSFSSTYGQDSGYGQYGQSYGQDPNGYSFQNQNPYSDPNGYPQASAMPTDGSDWNSLPGDVANGYISEPYTGATPVPKPTAKPVIDKAPDPIPPQIFNQVGQDLSILTYDVWGLPSLFGTQRKERFARLGDTLNRYDVVTLQSAFSDDIAVLKETTGFIHHFRVDNSSLVKTNSGLYVLSKYPILTSNFTPFTQCSGVHCLSNKGLLFIRIEHPKIGPIDIYTSHYQGGDSAKAKDIRMADHNRILQEAITRQGQNNPIIITGNFNFLPEQSEYQDLMRRLPLTDVFKKLHPTEAGYTYDPNNPNLAGEGTPGRLDYIFTMNTAKAKITPVEASVTHREAVDGLVLSDHYGVSAKLKIQR